MLVRAVEDPARTEEPREHVLHERDAAVSAFGEGAARVAHGVSRPPRRPRDGRNSLSLRGVDGGRELSILANGRAGAVEHAVEHAARRSGRRPIGGRQLSRANKLPERSPPALPAVRAAQRTRRRLSAAGRERVRCVYALISLRIASCFL